MDKSMAESFKRFFVRDGNISADEGFSALQMISVRRENQPPLEQYLDWCKSQPFIKVTEHVVPPGLLPITCQCSLIDIKVEGNRGSSDDVIYESNREIREKVARGNCILVIRKAHKVKYEFVVRGLKKFSGGLGDEDEREENQTGSGNSWNIYFTKSVDHTKKVTSLIKANGEAAHLSVRIENCVNYLFVGSKNVHLVIRHRSDIEKYEGKRYDVAKSVAYAVCDLLDNLEIERSEMLQKWMNYSKVTAIFEMLQPDYMHVENLSHLSRCQLNFIAWTSTNIQHDGITNCSLCALPPVLGIKMAAAFGLTTVKWAQFNFEDLDRRMNEIRRGYGYEGEVLYFLDDADNVIGLVKKKTIWYIVLRAIREKVKLLFREVRRFGNAGLDITIKKMETRLQEIKNWLVLDVEDAIIWKTLSVGFIRWTHNHFIIGEREARYSEGKFPVAWTTYLKMTAQGSLMDKLYPDRTDAGFS